MQRCPGCRARLAEGALCPRCGCDLTRVRQAEAQARRLLRRALCARLEGKRAQAMGCAAEALALERSALALAVVRLMERT